MDNSDRLEILAIRGMNPKIAENVVCYRRVLETRHKIYPATAAEHRHIPPRLGREAEPLSKPWKRRYLCEKPDIGR